MRLPVLQAIYLSTREVDGARYTFSFGDGGDEREGPDCTEWPHIGRSNRTIAGRLPLDEALKGSANTAFCVSHTYARSGHYVVRVRVLAPKSGAPTAAQDTWNLGGQVAVLPRPATTPATTPAASVSGSSSLFGVTVCRLSSARIAAHTATR